MAALALSAGCGDTTPTAPSRAAVVIPSGLDQAAVIAALDYWRDAAGLTYVIQDSGASPRLLIRAGTDDLAAWGGGRGLIDGTSPQDNQATSGLVVFEPASVTYPNQGGSYCVVPSYWACSYLYRHEIGHALGFVDHSDTGEGLMDGSRAITDQLSARELEMIRTLYALPLGAQVHMDGSWSAAPSGLSGTIDPQTARDIIAWNMTPPNGYKRTDMISRWVLPVQVLLVH